jgi:hypothetical protein
MPDIPYIGACSETDSNLVEGLGDNARMTQDPNDRTWTHARRRQRLSMRRNAKEPHNQEARAES